MAPFGFEEWTPDHHHHRPPSHIAITNSSSNTSKCGLRLWNCSSFFIPFGLLFVWIAINNSYLAIHFSLVAISYILAFGNNAVEISEKNRGVTQGTWSFFSSLSLCRSFFSFFQKASSEPFQHTHPLDVI